MRARTRLIRVTQASEYLGLSPNTLRNWVRAGLVPVLKSPTKRWFWTRELLDEIRNNMIDEGNNHVANASTPGTSHPVSF
jgi:predicted site-specific integrase-resolvase